MEEALAIAYRTALTRGYDPGAVVLFAVSHDAPNAADFMREPKRDRPDDRWMYGALEWPAASQLLGAKLAEAEALRSAHPGEVLIVWVLPGGSVKLETEPPPPLVEA